MVCDDVSSLVMVHVSDFHPAYAPLSTDRARRGDVHLPRSTRSLKAQSGPQSVMVIEYRLDRGPQMADTQLGRDLAKNNLTELVHRPATLTQLTHDRSQRDRTDTRTPRTSPSTSNGVGVGAGEGGGGQGQGFDGFSFEDVSWGEDHSRCPGTRYQLDGDDTVAAEVEETVIDAHLGNTQYLREQAAQYVLTL